MNKLNEIKRLRKKLDLNQKELAQQAGVSQSLIAKIEAGKIEPTYSKACRILDTLKDLEDQTEAKAEDLMNTKIVFIKPTAQVKEVIKIMKQKGISQIPVMKDKVVCGLINEKIILDQIVKGENMNTLLVEEIMDECPPIISLETKQRTILEILREHSIVLVARKGEIKGVISKSDLLGKF